MNDCSLESVDRPLVLLFFGPVNMKANEHERIGTPGERVLMSVTASGYTFFLTNWRNETSNTAPHEFLGHARLSVEPLMRRKIVDSG